MLGGLLSGWKFVHLQFFHIVLTIDRRISLHKVPSHACQCIMSPRSIQSNSHIYNLGGLVINLIITGISLYGMFAAGSQSILFTLSMCMFSSGISLLLMNGIPRIDRICNDMACFILTKKDKDTMLSHNMQFLIADKLSQGKTYSEIEMVLFNTISDIRINDITAYNILLLYYYHMDRDELEAASKALLRINDFSKVSKNVYHIYKMELFYLHMIMSMYEVNFFENSLSPNRAKEEQYQEENMLWGDIHTYRVKAMYQVYTMITEADILGASASLNDSIHKLNEIPCIYSGEKLFCQRQLRNILNLLQQV